MPLYITNRHFQLPQIFYKLVHKQCIYSYTNTIVDAQNRIRISLNFLSHKPNNNKRFRIKSTDNLSFHKHFYIIEFMCETNTMLISIIGILITLVRIP